MHVFDLNIWIRNMDILDMDQMSLWRSDQLSIFCVTFCHQNSLLCQFCPWPEHHVTPLLIKLTLFHIESVGNIFFLHCSIIQSLLGWQYTVYKCEMFSKCQAVFKEYWKYSFRAHLYKQCAKLKDSSDKSPVQCGKWGI